MVSALPAFVTLFGRQPTVSASAPGRVNLIGEHTDYNGGFVLPTVIPQRTVVELAPSHGPVVRLWSSAQNTGSDQYRLGQETPTAGWGDYIRGLTSTLARTHGTSIGGFDARIQSEVPPGSGLSSSAALGIAMLRALREAFALTLSDLELAQLVHSSENSFVGAHVGIMDPMVVSLGRPGAALSIDTRSLEFEHLPLPTTADLVVIDSGVRHALSSGDYNTRRAECEHACTLLGVEQLRDLGLDDLPRLTDLPEPLGRRARHVMTENARVLSAVAALRGADVQHLGALMNASHLSQRDDYEVSVPEVDLLVELARGHDDVYGARLTGGGFGGSVVIFAAAGHGTAVAKRVAGQYAAHTGREGRVLLPVGPVA